MSLRNSDGDKEVSPEVLADRQLTHAVECVYGNIDRPEEMSREIEQAFVRIGVRCKAADMVPLSTSIFGAGSQNGENGIVMVVVMCNWIFKDNLEAMQRQQALMNGPGPRRG